jgi:hypothetical protein
MGVASGSSPGSAAIVGYRAAAGDVIGSLGLAACRVRGYSDRPRISVCQKTSMSRYQMRKSMPGKLIRQTRFNASGSCVPQPGTSIRHSDEIFA